MTITFENYGKFYLALEYADGTELTYCGEESTLKECSDFIENKMSEDLTILYAILCDANTGEVVAKIERDNDDFIEDYEPPYLWIEKDYDECGYNPYMGCYDFDC